MDNTELVEKCREAVISYCEWLTACKERDALFAEAKTAYDNFLSICNEYKDADPDDEKTVAIIKNAQRNASVAADAARNSKKKASAMKIEANSLNIQANNLFKESGLSMEEIKTLLFAE